MLFPLFLSRWLCTDWFCVYLRIIWASLIFHHLTRMVLHVSYLLINLLFLWNPCIPPWPPPYPRCWVRSKCEKAFRPRYPQPPARARPAKRVSLEHRQVCCPRPFPSQPHSERVSRSSAGIHTQSEYVPHSFARSEWRDVFHWEARKTTRWRLFDAHNSPRHESNSTPARWSKNLH